MSQQPFAGIKVVEFGQFVAVPLAGQLLADGGAEVIKIEPMTGDPIRFIRSQGPGDTKFFICFNKGKHFLPLELKSELARPVIEALLKWADVVLLNLRPGLSEKLGIAPDQLSQRFPRLIIGSVSGFGNAGPEANDAGMDLVVQARSGLMAANGRVVNGRPAAIDSNSTVDSMAGMTLAFGISAALLRRERTGAGGVVNTSLLQAAMGMSSYGLCRAVDRDAKEHRKLLDQLAARRAEGASYEAQLASIQAVDHKLQKQLSNIYYTTYATQDSFIAVTCGSTPLRAKLCEATGIADDTLKPDFSGDYEAYYTDLAVRFRERLAVEPSEHWVAVLRKAGVPVSKVFMPIELFNDGQLAANGMLYDFEHPSHGTMTVLSPPVGLDEDGFRPQQPIKPFGAESDEMLLKLGFSPSQIDGLMAAGISHRGL